MCIIPQPPEKPYITSVDSVELSESVDGWMEAVRNYRWNRYNTAASVLLGFALVEWRHRRRDLASTKNRLLQCLTLLRVRGTF